MDFFDTKNAHTPEKGDLLISEPFLPDPNFERSVVYLCEHDVNGSFGFVLNRRSEVVLSELMEEIEVGAPIYVGGPVEQNTLHFLHRSSVLKDGAKEIGNQIKWGGSFDELLLTINTRQLQLEDIKFFVGYSGWSSGQLEEEITNNSWIVYKQAQADIIFDIGPKELWKRVMNRMGGRYKVMANYPRDPRMN